MKKFIVVVNMKNAMGADEMIEIKNCVERMSKKSVPAFFSGGCLGMIAHSEKASAQIRAALEQMTFMGNTTMILVAELGGDFNAYNGSNFWALLQHS